MRFLKSTIFAAALLIAFAGDALAQTGWQQTGQVTLSAGTTSGSTAVALPGTGTGLVVDNTAGTVPVTVATGGSSITVNTTCTTAYVQCTTVPAGGYVLLPLGSQSTYAAGITGSSTASPILKTGNGPYVAAVGGAGASGGGTVTANQGTSPWVDNTAQVNGATVNVGTGASSTGTQRVTTSTDSTIATITNPVTAAQATAANLNATVVGTGTFSVQNTAATPAGQNGIGNVGGKTVAVCVTPTVTASNAYGINYVVGGLLTFANAFTSTGSGILQGVVVTINDNETSGFTFFPFNANPSGTTWTDAAVAAIVAGDVAKVRNPVSLNGNNQLKSTVFSVYSAAGLGEALAPGTTSLYGVLIANAALTNNFAGTSDVQVCVKVLDDE